MPVAHVMLYAHLVSSQSQTFPVTFRLDQMFSDAFSRDHQLMRVDPKHSLYLACALIVRGGVELSDIRRNIDRLAGDCSPVDCGHSPSFSTVTVGCVRLSAFAHPATGVYVYVRLAGSTTLRIG